MAIRYKPPANFLKFDLTVDLFHALVDAKAGMESLRALPYQKSWMEPLKEMELKNEVAGTSMIEGATFIGDEFNTAFQKEDSEELQTRSQRQIISAKKAYQWIETAPLDLPVEKAIKEIHRLMITGSDDDHCSPGKLRSKDQNVTFGIPEHRGASGGEELESAFSNLVKAASSYYVDHEPLLQALAVHYHLAAIHPFVDGNGRCARGVEAYLLRRAGYTTHGFIGLSNYYYEEKNQYLRVLAETREKEGNLTAFFVFGLKGITLQTARIRNIISKQNKIVLFKNMMFRVYRKYDTKRRRALSERQINILEYLLDQPEFSVSIENFIKETDYLYKDLKRGGHAFKRDLNNLLNLKSIKFTDLSKVTLETINDLDIWVNLDWPQVMTDTEFGQKILEKPTPVKLPKLKL